MPFCSKCGFQADIDDDFCARCGAEIKYVPTGKEKEQYTVDWKKKKKEESFWQISKKSLKDVFFDNEEKLSKKRKMINLVVIILILIVGISIFWPYISSDVNITFGNVNSQNRDGTCRYRLNARNIDLADAKFFTSTKTMNFLVINNRKEDLVIERIAKTYEFRTDNRGETEIEELNKRIPAKTTINLTFSVREEPYILGLEFNNCEKGKISEWEVIE